MSLNQSRFTIINADVILSSDTEEANIVDIRNNILELTLFEALTKSYCDARVVMVDDFGFRTDLSIQGTERLSLVVADGNNPLKGVITKTFFISKINDAERINERSEVISIDLVEEHVYVNAMKQISRSYESTLEEAIKDISLRDLGKTVVETDFFEGSAQGERKVIVPYLSPLEAMTWLTQRMTSRTGAPIYVHGDLYSPYLYISSLENLMQIPVLNEKLPLRYTDATSAGDEETEALKIYYQVSTFQEVNTEDSLALYEEGAIGSSYTNIDAGTGQSFTSHISVRDILDDFYTNGIIDNTSAQSIFDPSLFIGDKPSDEYDAMNIHQVTSTKTYNQFKSYHDETQLIEDDALLESRLKVKNKVIRQIIRKNVIDIEMDGALFLEKKISPGRRLRILFLSPNTQGDARDVNKTIDKRKSGDYMLMNTAHTMSQDRHRVSARMFKLGDLPSDFTL